MPPSIAGKPSVATCLESGAGLTLAPAERPPAVQQVVRPERWLRFSGLAVFATLLIVRTMRHPMWRDELQAWMLARAAGSLAALFGSLHYEGHPSLWYILLWILTRFSAEPVCLQALQAVLATAFIALLWLRSPFTVVECALLSTSHFLFSLYAIQSRDYTLMTAAVFLFCTLRAHLAKVTKGQAVVLGALANTNIFGMFAAASLLGTVLPARRGAWRRSGAALLIIAILVSAAVVTMWPAGDEMSAAREHLVTRWSPERLEQSLGEAVSAFSVYAFWRYPFHRWFHIDADFLVTLLLFALAAYSLGDSPPAQRGFLAMGGMMLALSYFRYMLFPYHWGALFVLYLGAVWLVRRDAQMAPPRRLAWLVLIAVSSFAGLMFAWSWRGTPYSQGRAAAAWIEAHVPASATIVATPDFTGATVAGYLQRPVYYLECRCEGTFVRWSTARRPPERSGLEHELRSLLASKRAGVFLVLSVRNLDLAPRAPDLASVELARFEPAVMSDEAYVVYRVDPVPGGSSG
jgi:hypothetical protein